MLLHRLARLAALPNLHMAPRRQRALQLRRESACHGAGPAAGSAAAVDVGGSGGRWQG